MRLFKRLLILISFVTAMKTQAQDTAVNTWFNWQQTTPLPDSDGFAGVCAGVSNGALLVAGGSNFPGNGRPWNNGVKSWHKTIYALDKPGGVWKAAGELPVSTGYGVALTCNEGVLYIGGADATQHYASALLLQYRNGKVQIAHLPDMPSSLAYACGAIVHNTVYIAGGAAAPGSATVNTLYSIDLSLPAAERKWQVLPALPASSRMLAMAGTSEQDFYVMGGVHLNAAGTREYLQDVWRYTPGKGWLRMADLPQVLAAAPSPAFNAGQSHLLLFGGDDGANAAKVADLKDNHPGFSNKVVAYNTLTNTWSVTGNMPVHIQADAAVNPHASTYAPVTTPLVVWNGNAVIAGGEARPAVRSNRVLVAAPAQPPGKFGWADWLVIALYFVAVAGISFYVTKNTGGTTGDFFLGGQKIPWWAAGLSIFGSKLSALTFIAIPAKAYATDWVYLMNNVMIVAVAPIVTLFYLPYFRKLKITSVYQYLQIRFNPTVKLLGSFTFVIFQLSRLGVVIYLPALVLSTVTGVPIFACILVTTLITTAYSMAGGIEAVVWTEVMQVFVLLGGALVSILFIHQHTHGGLQAMLKEAGEQDKFRVANLGWSMSQPVLWVVIIGSFLTNLVTYTSDQVVVQRYLTTATEKEARRSIYTNAIMVIPATILFFGVGTALWFYFRHHPAQLNPHGRTDDVFPWFISQELPAGLSGLVIAGLFAATMSTISSSMNAIATVVTTDFYKPFRKQATDRQCLLFAKKLTMFLGIIGCGIAVYLVYLQNTSIWDQYLKIIGLFGGCLAGMFAAGIFFPRINSKGILLGFITGCAGLYFVQRSSSIHFFLYPLFAVAGCLFWGYLFSLLFPEKNKQSPAAATAATLVNP
ncbi:sodium:solute symporter family transporter [Deminuibacter soli]|uniref:Sodium:solute symporter n=1 Tax=Deminuibacter soli TaxID=2291815 RepID=A0A3E1NHQ2_9BACT|nr:sodium/solute symporter [Deminuibacter soli]RFM27475.1 sodium:solute symporter [Deminuibacter soli]